MEVNLSIDLKGLRCPLPVLRTKKALSQLCKGEVLCVFATDSAATQDIPAFVHQSGCLLLQQDAVADGHYFYIRKQ